MCDIVTHGMTICDLVTHGRTMCDIVTHRTMQGSYFTPIFLYYKLYCVNIFIIYIYIYIYLLLLSSMTRVIYITDFYTWIVRFDYPAQSAVTWVNLYYYYYYYYIRGSKLSLVVAKDQNTRDHLAWILGNWEYMRVSHTGYLAHENRKGEAIILERELTNLTYCQIYGPWRQVK